jgi:SAM-dependent methyltransferase
MSFYSETLRKLISTGRLDPTRSTLVVAGGETDRQTLLAAGFTDVVISNLDSRMTGSEFAPFAWEFLDGENLTIEPGRFDQIIVHLALHHFGSPHRGLLEMYQCAARCVLAMENRDSLTMRLAVRLGLVPLYEFQAVAGHDYRFGGMRNTAVPNAVYRWTEREVHKTLLSYDPAYAVPVRFYYGLRLPHERIKAIRNPLVRLPLRAALVPFSLFAKLFPKQGNDLAIFIDKDARRLQPWIDPQTGTLTPRSWAALDRNQAGR